MDYFTRLICIGELIRDKFKVKFRKCRNLRQCVSKVINLYILEKYSNIFRMISDQSFIDKLDLVKQYIKTDIFKSIRSFK